MRVKIFKGKRGNRETATVPVGFAADRLLPAYLEPAVAEAASTLAATVADRTPLSPAVHADLVATLYRGAWAGAQLQWGDVAAAGLFDAAIDTIALAAAAKARFSGDQFPGLAKLGDAQQDAVFSVLPAIGLADRPAGSPTLVVRFPTGGVAIVETIGGLHACLPDGDPVTVAFTAATDSVLWGAVAVQAAQSLFDPASVSAVSASTPTLKRSDPAVTHILSFIAFEDLFAAQGQVFDQIPSVTELRITNPSDEKVVALLERRPADPALGPSVLVVEAPLGATEILTHIAMTHRGTLHPTQ